MRSQTSRSISSNGGEEDDVNIMRFRLGGDVAAEDDETFEFAGAPR
jgi:hypothetical protein